MPSSLSRSVVTQPHSALLDLDDSIGQRDSTFRFDLVDIVTGYRTPIHPRRDAEPTISHDVSRSIVRQLTGLNLIVDDTTRINVITSRVEPFMIIDGDTAYPTGRPLGRFMFNNKLDFQFTSGTISSSTLYDEGFIVDQPLSQAFGPTGSLFSNTNCQALLQSVLQGLPIVAVFEPSTFTTSSAGWSTGTQRGFIVQQLALDGDYFPPWFGNDTKMHFIRSFDPATHLVTFDLDAGNRVYRDRIIRTDDLIDAPNRFIVISNSASAAYANAAIFGSYDIPSSAPHSIANRGFIIPKVEDRQVDSTFQASAVARNLGLQQTIFERIELYTPPDPRHDSYDVLRWQGENWLEIAWSMPLTPGAQMQHVARKIYMP